MVLVVKNPPANTGDIIDSGSISGWERSPGEGNGNPLQYSCLENSMDKGAWFTGPKMVLGGRNHPITLVFVVVVVVLRWFFFVLFADVFVCTGILVP